MTELWLVDLEAAAPALEALERDLPRLSGDDRARALRPNDARERRHRLAAYTGLRIVLERVEGAEVRGQRFVRGPGGKPGLPAGGATVFSLSHTDGLALIGVARGGTIGVDLERTRTLRMSSRRREEIWPWPRGLRPFPSAIRPATKPCCARGAGSRPSPRLAARGCRTCWASSACATPAADSSPASKSPPPRGTWRARPVSGSPM
jgi:4'-phosphopantetheinyl transferase